MKRFILILILLLVCACAAHLQEDHASFDRALSLFNENRLADALPLFYEAVVTESVDATAWAYLAETYRRLDTTDKAVRAAALCLELDSCNGFAHVVIAEATRKPSSMARSDDDTNWIHYMDAVACDSMDGNAWIGMWGETILRRKFEMMRHAERMIYESGILTPAMLEYGRWMLRTLPENAILITNGDIDTYTTLALQQAEGFRTDVLIAEYGILGTRQFVDYLRSRNDIELPVSNDELDSLDDRMTLAARIVKGWRDMVISGKLKRSLAFAVTLDERLYSDFNDDLTYKGPFLQCDAEKLPNAIDTTAIRASIDGIEPTLFAAPWASETDRSPVRHIYNQFLSGNITWMCLKYCRQMIASGRNDEATAALDLAQQFEESLYSGPRYLDDIGALRDSIRE